MYQMGYVGGGLDNMGDVVTTMLLMGNLHKSACQ